MQNEITVAACVDIKAALKEIPAREIVTHLIVKMKQDDDTRDFVTKSLNNAGFSLAQKKLSEYDIHKLVDEVMERIANISSDKLDELRLEIDGDERSMTDEIVLTVAPLDKLILNTGQPIF